VSTTTLTPIEPKATFAATMVAMANTIAMIELVNCEALATDNYGTIVAGLKFSK
jgi:hypothetical protein